MIKVMKTTSILNLLLFVTLFTISCKNNEVEKKTSLKYENPILGSWEMLSINWIGKDTTYTIDKAQPGIFYFTPKRYGIMWTPTQKPRKAFTNLSRPTNEEIISGFRSVIFNGGSYTFTDSTLTTVAKIAKVPGFEGGIQFYRYSIVNDTLRLLMFDETYPNGDKPKWVSAWVTEFIMKKAE